MCPVMAAYPDFSEMRVLTVHAEDYPVARQRWTLGWLVVDPAEDLAIAVLSMNGSPDDARAAIVQILYCRQYPYGKDLVSHARDDAAAMGVTLYRSGHATPEGAKACEDLDLAPGEEEKTLDPVRAREAGRKALEFAAGILGVEAIPRKGNGVD